MDLFESYIEIIARHSRPLDPIPTDCAPEWIRLDRVRAVLFDVYGTMLVSASGDIGAASGTNRETAAEEALEASGIAGKGLGSSVVRSLDAAIVAEHQRKRSLGCAYPEVNIVHIWEEVLASIPGPISPGTGPDNRVPVDAQRVAVEYEIRTNPVWPMPGLVDCLTNLARSGMILGIISNAQFYTRLLFPALLEKSLTDLAFDPDVQYYSYRSGEAKPSEMMVRQAAETLGRRGVRPDEILYVGNDLLNDILPASKVGFRTALFAGDQRSLRLRAEDDRVKDVRPDIVVTHLAMLSKCVGTNSK